MSNPAAHRSWLSRLVEVPAGRLNSVLLRPQRLDSWILLRSGVGTLVVFWAMILLPDLNDLYGPTSIVPSPFTFCFLQSSSVRRSRLEA